MTKYVLALLLIWATNAVGAQYELVHPVYICQNKFDVKSYPFYDVMYKTEGNQLYIYEKNPVAEEKDTMVVFTVKRMNLDSEKMLDSFKLPAISNNYYITDILPVKGGTLILSNGRVKFIEKGKITDIGGIKNIDYRFGLKLNDTLLLLYDLYNFHPADGERGLHMNLFNLKKREVTKSVNYNFPGSAIGFTTINWVTTDEKFIYAFAGISGRLFKYDFNLKLVEERNIGVFEDSIAQHNRVFENTMDSTVNTEWTRVRKIVDSCQKIGVRGNYKSPIFSREYMGKVSGELKENMNYIQKVIKVSNEEFLLVVCRPGYGNTYRDVYAFNPKNNITALKWKKWVCYHPKEIDKIEDYFTVDLLNERVTAPFFYKNSVYAPEYYDMKIFKKGTPEELEALYHEDILNNGYKWQLVKFKL